MTKITKAMQAAQIVELRAQLEQALADNARLRAAPVKPDHESLGVKCDERGYYICRGDYADFKSAFTAAGMAAKVLDKTVRLV